MVYKLYEDDSDFFDLYKNLKLDEDNSCLNEMNTHRFDPGMLSGYAETQPDFGERLPRSDNGNALFPAILRDRGAIDDDAEWAKSNFLRSEKSGYETGDFDTRDLNGAGDSVSTLFKKNYGYTPSAGELNQYASLIKSSAPDEFSANIRDSDANLLSRMHTDQLNEMEGTPQARGLLSKFSGNDNDREEAGFDKLINGYSEKEDSTGNSEYDQSRPGQDDMKREIDLLNRRTNTLASDSKSGVISSNGRDYYLTMRDPNGLGIYQNMDVGASLPEGRRSDQGTNVEAMQKVVVTGKPMSDQEKENYDREQMQLSMQKYRPREQAQSGNNSNSLLKVPAGQITFNAEGNDVPKSQFFTRTLHHPTAGSGVTIGRGYDMKERTPEQVKQDLISAGLSQEQAEKYARGATLKGEKAEQFVRNNRAAFEPLPRDVQNNLFSNFTYPTYVSAAKRNYQKSIAGNPSAVPWNDLDDKVKDIAIDFQYQQGRIYNSQMSAIQSNNRDILVRSIIDDPRTLKYEQGRQRSAYLRRN
ncbi:pesticin C-terminus-like muramidase [Undibacterium sp. JH2W]|uniref:pesticin C-terminus-like muramidase n=1 Tax=Undibacterium sp. JH2W TaxID=3413037 RepID=UPI003BF20F31